MNIKSKFSKRGILLIHNVKKVLYKSNSMSGIAEKQNGKKIYVIFHLSQNSYLFVNISLHTFEKNSMLKTLFNLM